ncbi:MAG: YheC/YheD family protein [Alicyclobacillus sp.]|nr:YheC/YheD family protein [Alicyclobacillus sp.]
MRKPELGKYALWRLFAGDPKIRRLLPDTRRFSRSNLAEMLRRYGMVYVKPSGGSRGVGIMKVWRVERQVYVKHTIRATRSFDQLDAAVAYVDRHRGGRPYIVQQGVDLARVGGRPFDIRVMMQRTRPGGPWRYSGMVAKLAGAGSVVTNVALSHGTVLEVPVALRRAFGWNRERVAETVAALEQLGHRAARRMDAYQPYRELGLDVAVDRRGRLWLLEENTGPSHRLFRKLTSNLSMFRRIEFRYGQYARAVRAKYAGHRA